MRPTRFLFPPVALEQPKQVQKQRRSNPRRRSAGLTGDSLRDGRPLPDEHVRAAKGPRCVDSSGICMYLFCLAICLASSRVEVIAIREAIASWVEAIAVCICVCTSVLFGLLTRSSSWTQHFTLTLPNEATSEMEYPAWPAGCTCQDFLP